MQLLFTSFKELEISKKIFFDSNIKTLSQAIQFDTMLKNLND